MLPYSAFSRAKAIPKTGPHAIYGVFGDGLLQRQIIAALVEWVLPEDARDFNLDTLDGETTTITDILARCGNLPFLADQRVVIVSRAERLEGIARGGDEDGESKPKGKAKSSSKSAVSPSKRFSDGLTKLPDTTILILARTPETPEIGSKAAAPRCLNANLDKAIEARGGLLINAIVGPKDSHLAASVVQNEAAKQNIPLERGAGEHLVSRVGLDLELLLGELEKCSLRAGTGNLVTRQIIDEMTRRAPQETIFDLTDAIGARQTPRALGLLRELVESGEAPERILSNFVWHLRQLLQARAFLDAGLRLDNSLQQRMPRELSEQLPREAKDNLAMALQFQAWKAPRLAAQARNFSQSQITEAMERALAVDLAIKGIEGDGGADARKLPELLLDIFLVELS